MITEADRRVAASMFELACRLVVRQGDEADVEVALAAIRARNSSACRALLAQGRGKPWLPSFRDAMAEIGVCAAADVLGGTQEPGDENG